MTAPRRSIAAFAAAILLADSALILLALTLLFHALGTPAVHAFDLDAQQRIHAFATPALTNVLLAFTWLGAIRIFAPALALATALLLWQRRRRLAALLSLPIAAAFLLNEALKLHFHRARPTVSWAIGDEHTFSFPSGHSFFAVVLYGTLTCVALRRPASPLRRTGLIALAFALPLAIGLSRIYLGMHYPTDVLAGYLAGTLWLTAVLVLEQRWPSFRAQ